MPGPLPSPGHPVGRQPAQSAGDGTPRHDLLAPRAPFTTSLAYLFEELEVHVVDSGYLKDLVPWVSVPEQPELAACRGQAASPRRNVPGLPVPPPAGRLPRPSPGRRDVKLCRP